MEIKKFVAIVLVVSISLLIPLQALAQIEPQITYGEWCAHLGELHTELHAQQEAQLDSSFIMAATGVISALLASVVSFCWASYDEGFIAAGFFWLAVGYVIYVVYFPDKMRRSREIKALYGERTIADVQQTIADVQREIELWEQAGAARMWFYPCK